MSDLLDLVVVEKAVPDPSVRWNNTTLCCCCSCSCGGVSRPR
jgi:hypothetical protein